MTEEQKNRDAAMPADESTGAVRSVQYASFDESGGRSGGGGSIDAMLDVPLKVAAELGRCAKSVKDILDFEVGSIIALNRPAGDMVDVVVNGKLFARGEVVVIDDTYGVRVADVVDAAGLPH